MKKLLLPFFCMSCVSAISAQNIPEDADTLSIGLKEVKVMASYGHDKGVEPVVLSTISAKDIATKLSNQEFPEIMKSTPSIYATKQGGGFGDSRLMLRGFGSENIAVLINGIPVNGMENGSVYWSNWSGLADVTNSIQVQRGNPHDGRRIRKRNEFRSLELFCERFEKIRTQPHPVADGLRRAAVA